METLTSIGLALCYIVLGYVSLVTATLVKHWTTKTKLRFELLHRDNPAVGLTVTGYYCAVIILFIGATHGPALEDPTPTDLARDIGIDFLYVLGGILALNIGRLIVDKTVLVRFSTAESIVEDRNIGTGAVEFGNYVATGLIVAGSLHGEGSPLTAVVFFLAGQLVLTVFALFYQWMVRYDVRDAIGNHNAPAGVALGASLIAIGIILLKSTMGDFVGWGENFAQFGFQAATGFVALMAMRYVTDLALLPGVKLRHEIVDDRNINAAWIEGIVAIGMAAIIFFML